MPDSTRLQTIVESAERAAAAGDLAGAERLLREALALQEVELGAAHPDLANTLNNLGVLCERANNPAEAERCYRRAYAIATAAFAPDHPFVATSRRNLAEFCAAHDIPLERVESVAPPAPVEPPGPAGPPSPAAPRAAPAPSPAPVPASVPRAPSARQSRSQVAIWSVLGVLVLIVAAALWLRQGEPAQPSASGSADVPAATPESPRSAAKSAAAEAPTAVTPPPARQPATPPASKPTPEPFPKASAGAPRQTTPPPARGSASTDTAAPTVVDVKLCRALETRAGEWTCTPLADPAAPGPVYFYTRLRTTRDAVVVHRWYYNDRLQWTRELHIRTNLGPGYRTYSRYTPDGGRAGTWRVELTTPDGQVLRALTFVVR